MDMLVDKIKFLFSNKNFLYNSSVYNWKELKA